MTELSFGTPSASDLGPQIPRSTSQFARLIADEEHARNWLWQLRDRSDWACTRCNTATFYEMADGQRRCVACHYEQSVTHGTVFEHSHLPLRVWLQAAWHMTARPSGIAPRELSQLTRRPYSSCMRTIHRLQALALHVNDVKLDGAVEIGLLPVGRHAAWAAVERGPGGQAVIRMLGDTQPQAHLPVSRHVTATAVRLPPGRSVAALTEIVNRARQTRRLPRAHLLDGFLAELALRYNHRHRLGGDGFLALCRAAVTLPAAQGAPPMVNSPKTGLP